VIAPWLLTLARCPTCTAETGGHAPPLTQAESALLCPRCGRQYPVAQGYLDLMPQQDASLGHTSRYVADLDEFAERLDYRDLGPPLLGAAVRNRLLRRMLRLRPRDRVLELGCGDGRFLVWNLTLVGQAVGIDPAPLFADVTLAEVPLARADARLLPFPDESFTKAWSIDVLEHLTRADIRAYLGEARRVLVPNGLLFLFSNTRERGPFDLLVSGSRRLANGLARLGLVDPRRDLLRKSDHIKALETYPELQVAVEEAGFEIVRVVFWNGVFQSFIDNVLMRLVERGAVAVRLRRQGKRSTPTPDSPHADALSQEAIAARTAARARVARGGLAALVLHGLTRLMWLDIVLFGRFRTGPYFLLLRKRVVTSDQGSGISR
jgi:ubiquinone/menaquinone biosynthesis C-methylase UbiE